jgi:hypothetical protein
MAPHQNTRSRHQPLTAPLPPRTRPAATGAPSGLALLPLELRMMVWKASNEADRNNGLTLACRPENQGRARRGHLWLIKGHTLSKLAGFLGWEADDDYPFNIIRDSYGQLIVQVDISSRRKHHSLWAICETLSAQEGDLVDLIDYVKIKGWTCMSFHALVHLIADCGSIDPVRLQTSVLGCLWADCMSRHVELHLNRMYRGTFKYGRRNVGINNIPYVARKLWTYLSPPAHTPMGGGHAALEEWATRHQTRMWMNSAFLRSRTWEEALRRS